MKWFLKSLPGFLDGKVNFSLWGAILLLLNMCFNLFYVCLDPHSPPPTPPTKFLLTLIGFSRNICLILLRVQIKDIVGCPGIRYITLLSTMALGLFLCNTYPLLLLANFGGVFVLKTLYRPILCALNMMIPYLSSPPIVSLRSQIPIFGSAWCVLRKIVSPTLGFVFDLVIHPFGGMTELSLES